MSLRVLAALLIGASSAPAADLAALSADFKREVIKVTEGVHVAVGFGLGNAILLEGRDGVVIVDTLESAEAAQVVRAEFRRLTRKPVRAIVYTHHHADHVRGAGIFAGKDKPQILSHEALPREFEKSLTGTSPIIGLRSMRMFGTALDDKQRLNAGVGSHLALNERSTAAYLPPTRTFRDRLEIVLVEGLRVELVHAPGETADQLFVWLPAKKVLLCGDNFYRSFPNLYTIRGTTYRQVREWAAAIDLMRDRAPEFLVPSHGRPLSGAPLIQSVLTDYRDAIQYVHDQTIRGLNRGMTSDDLATTIKLPTHLARSPYLQEYYGKVSWSVRAICTGSLGWYDGDSVNLLPLPPVERARRMADLAGGEMLLLKKAEEALGRKDHQWALELVGYLLRLRPDSERAREVRMKALEALGQGQQNAPARNYYLTQARELAKDFQRPGRPRLDRQTVHALSLDAVFNSLAVNLAPKATQEADRKVSFRFTGPNEVCTVHVRRGVAEVRFRLDPKPHLLVTADAAAWKEVLFGLRKLDDAIKDGTVTITGERRQLDEFLGWFRSP